MKLWDMQQFIEIIIWTLKFVLILFYPQNLQNTFVLEITISLVGKVLFLYMLQEFEYTHSSSKMSLTGLMEISLKFKTSLALCLLILSL